MADMPRRSPLYNAYILTEWDIVEAWYKTRQQTGRDGQDAPSEAMLVDLRNKLRGDVEHISLHWLRNVLVAARKAGRCKAYVHHMEGQDADCTNND